MILWLLRPRDYHEWMTLQERPEADRRHPHPQVDGLSGFDVKLRLKLYADPDHAIFVGKMGSRATVTEDAVPADDHIAFSNAMSEREDNE